MQVLKTASFNDYCKSCGPAIPDEGGCTYSYSCDSCCAAAGHDHPWLSKPAAVLAAPSKTVPFQKKALEPEPFPPGQEHVRLAEGEEYLGTTVSGTHIYIPASGKASRPPRKETIIPRELLRRDGSVDVQKVLARSEAAIASGKAAVAAAAPSPGVTKSIVGDSFAGFGTPPGNSGRFTTVKCTRCGDKFETQVPVTRDRCNDCVGYLR